MPADSESKNRQRRLVHGHSVVAKVSTWPPAATLIEDGFIAFVAEVRLPHSASSAAFCGSSAACSRPSYAASSSADMRKAEKVERLRLPSPRHSRLSIACGPNSKSRVFSRNSSPGSSFAVLAMKLTPRSPDRHRFLRENRARYRPQNAPRSCRRCAHFDATLGPRVEWRGWKV